ncbi:MAG: pyruvate kinase alpha/beta domain-containing protein, partial [Elainellaceae cyanobacterium]
TSTGYTAMIAAGERPNAVVVAFTSDVKVYHRLNLVWGVKPILLDHDPDSFEGMVISAENELLKRNLAAPGHQVLIMGGVPSKTPQGTNFLKLHRISDEG